MDFGQALHYVKKGECAARKGWNGKRMFIYLNKGSVDLANSEAPGAPASITHVNNVSVRLFENGDAGTVTRMPNLNMRAADGSIVTGWLASQTDMLAEDWDVVPK